VQIGVRMGFSETGCEGVDCAHETQKRVQRWVLTNVVLKPLYFARDWECLDELLRKDSALLGWLDLMDKSNLIHLGV
jgi:hypothetical protein